MRLANINQLSKELQCPISLRSEPKVRVNKMTRTFHSTQWNNIIMRRTCTRRRVVSSSPCWKKLWEFDYEKQCDSIVKTPNPHAVEKHYEKANVKRNSSVQESVLIL